MNFQEKESISKDITYDFPNEDFCIFNKIPLDRINLTIFKSKTINCSCALRWLLFNINIYKQSFIDMNNNLPHDIRKFKSKEKIFDVCIDYDLI